MPQTLWWIASWGARTALWQNPALSQCYSESLSLEAANRWIPAHSQWWMHISLQWGCKPEIRIHSTIHHIMHMFWMELEADWADIFSDNWNEKLKLWPDMIPQRCHSFHLSSIFTPANKAVPLAQCFLSNLQYKIPAWYRMIVYFFNVKKMDKKYHGNMSIKFSTFTWPCFFRSEWHERNLCNIKLW